MKTCPECSKPYRPKRFDQQWCSAECNKKAMNRAFTRGQIVYRALYGMATDRGPQRKLDFAFVMREVRQWAAEDRAAGRLPPPRHQHGYDRGHHQRRVT